MGDHEATLPHLSVTPGESDRSNFLGGDGSVAVRRAAMHTTRTAHGASGDMHQPQMWQRLGRASGDSGGCGVGSGPARVSNCAAVHWARVVAACR